MEIFLGLKCTFAAILRTVGEQFKGSIIVAVCFYLIGLPLGLGLMLYTNLELYGNLIRRYSSNICHFS